MSIQIGNVTAYDVPELSKLLGLEVRTVREYISKGRLKGVKLGKKYYVTQEALELFFKAPLAGKEPNA